MMMKRSFTFIILVTFCLPVWAGIADDGVIESGEYTYGVINLEDQALLVTGGGAYRIHAKESSDVEVWNTSPLSNSGGITQLIVDDKSRLEVYGGEIGTIDLRNESTAELYGGEIQSITNMQLVGEVGKISIYCQSDWEWLYDDVDVNKIVGINGLWSDDIAFSIHFVDDDLFGYDPVYMNINVIPEPATLSLLGLGGLLIRRKK